MSGYFFWLMIVVISKNKFLVVVKYIPESIAQNGKVGKNW